MQRTSGAVIGILLIAGGILLTLANLGYLNFGDVIWGLTLGAFGAGFMAVFLTNRANWWAIIPGVTLLSVSAIVLLGEYAPAFSDNWGGVIILGGISLAFWLVYLVERTNWWALIPGSIMLIVAIAVFLSEVYPGLPGAWTGAIIVGGIGLAFWAIYLVNRQFWWAVIPGGVMLTIGVMVLLEPYLTGLAMGGTFFLGIGLTFALLSILPTPDGRMRWAIYPAGVLAIMGLLLMASLPSVLNILWPVALILIGLFLIYRTVTRS